MTADCRRTAARHRLRGGRPAAAVPRAFVFLRRCLLAACLGLAGAAAATGQQPASPPRGEPTPVVGIAGEALRTGQSLLDAEDPTGAWQAFRRSALFGGDAAAVGLGLGAAHLMLGQSAFALAWAEAALHRDPRSQAAMALAVRARIRDRRFDEAVATADGYLATVPAPDAELRAARASALFRVQRTDDAAAAYQAVLAIDPLHAEAHLRLGSGLLGPSEAPPLPQLVAAAGALARGDRGQAIAALGAALAVDPAHPVAHRLLGEALFAQKAAAAMAANDAAFLALATASFLPPIDAHVVGEFVPGHAELASPRQRVVDRTAALFAQHLPKLVAIGGRHDLLVELARTTDAQARANLRGKRTFDGRFWDDVRGVGGVHAATGIEALDEAAAFGFDTFAHEVAHQVHYYAFTPAQRARLRALYRAAVDGGRCLDYYAATNEAEYFGQGVEAFVSLGKRPGGETTHGHTRFELRRVDPELHDFVAGLVSWDPLADAARREPLLVAAVAVALRVGRPDDAVVAAGMMAPGPGRDRWLAAAERAALALRCH
jgi:tetratricopeptide (TPR) repeat protein